MARHIDGEWNGWNGDTTLRLTDGSEWQQAEYHYEYRYSYRPEAVLEGDKLLVAGMSRAVRVRRVY